MGGGGRNDIDVKDTYEVHNGRNCNVTLVNFVQPVVNRRGFTYWSFSFFFSRG